MAVMWFKQSLKERNKKVSEQQTQQEMISEIQDALIEIAGIVETMAVDSGEGGGNNG